MAQHHPPHVWLPDDGGWQEQDDWARYQRREDDGPPAWSPRPPRPWADSPPVASVPMSRPRGRSGPHEEESRPVPSVPVDESVDRLAPAQRPRSLERERNIDTHILPYKQPTKHPPQIRHPTRAPSPLSEPRVGTQDPLSGSDQALSSSEKDDMPSFDTRDDQFPQESQVQMSLWMDPGSPFHVGWQRPPPHPSPLPPPPPQTTLAPPIQYAPPPPEDPSWTRVRTLREDNWALRSQIHELRVVLRDKQMVKSTADDVLMRSFLARELLPPDQMAKLKEAQSLAELRKDSQAARDEYGPLEDDCNELEDRLSRQEFELTNLERQLYAPRPTLSPQFQPLAPPPLQRPPTAAPSVSSSSTSSDSDPDDLHHPAVKLYLSLLGDLDILHERLDDFTDERAALSEQRLSRQHYGLTLDADDQAWLDVAPSAYNQLVSELQTVQAKVDALYTECLSKGLVDEDGEPTDFATQEQFALREDVDSKGEVSAYVRFAELLPVPDPRHCDVETQVVQSSLHAAQLPPPAPNASIPPVLRTNKWLLERLCTSAMEVDLLASTFELEGGVVWEGWQMAVLGVWFGDRTMRRVGVGRRADERSMKTQAPARIDVEGVEIEDDEEREDELENDGDEEDEEEEDDEEDDEEESPIEENEVRGLGEENGRALETFKIVVSPSYKLPSNRSIALEGSDGGVMVAAGPVWGNGGVKVAASC